MSESHNNESEESLIIAVNFRIHCDDHSSLSSITAVQNELFHVIKDVNIVHRGVR